jgi:predicted nucleic acid-binding protein
MIVLDANILIRAVLGRRVRQILETYSAQKFRFVAPEIGFDEAQKYLPHEDFFGTGVAAWTTNRIEILLRLAVGKAELD